MKLNKPISVLLDTDIGPDCDDTGALAVLHNLARNGEVRALGIMHCTSNIYGAGCIDAINHFYGYQDIPVGTLNKDDFLVGEQYEKFNRYITENYENSYRDKKAPDAVKLYRKILNEQADISVDIIALGPLVNLADLLKSEPDENCELSGMELVSKKVKRLVTMAGRFIPHENGVLYPEWNVKVDIPSAQKVFHNWPSPIVFCGFEVGDPVITGKRLFELCNDDNPVKKAYELYIKDKGRNSWDLITVLYAVRGGCGFWELSEPGKVCIDNSGVSHFIKNDRGIHQYLKTIAPAFSIIAEYIDKLLIGS